MKLIPAARLYTVVLPEADAMAKHLATVPHVDLEQHLPMGSGFVPVYGESLVHTFAGGYAFALRYDEKVVPKSAVVEEVKKRATAFEDAFGYVPGRKALREIRENVMSDLCAKALTRSKTTICYYNTTEEILVIPTTSRKLCDTITGQMVRAVESVKSSSIHVAGVRNSLTNHLKGYLFHDEDAFGNMEVGSRCKLASAETKFSFDLDNLNTATDGIIEATKTGAEVTEIAMSFSGVSFRLVDDFSLKGIAFEGIEPSEDEDQFAYEASAQLLMLSAVVKELCQMFGYKPVEEDLLG